jgi:hypothetical protein
MRVVGWTLGMEGGVGHHWINIEGEEGDKEKCGKFRLHGIESLIWKFSLVHTYPGKELRSLCEGRESRAHPRQLER